MSDDPSEVPGTSSQSEPASGVAACYRHPNVETRVRCTRCGRPICPDCMIPAAVGHQCPECVKEARRAFRTGYRRGAIRISSGQATRALLYALVAMFVLEVALSNGRGLMTGPSGKTLLDLGAMFPPSVAQGQYWRLITVMFLHENLLHIAFNGYALWLFGQFVENAFGSIRFLLIFFVTGFLASAASYAYGPVGEIAVGASGAIFGLFGAFIVFNLRRRDLELARRNLGWAVIMLALNAFLAFQFSGIDWRAHLGGLVAGVFAGTFAEGFGPRSIRPVVRVVGFVALVAVGVAVTVVRSHNICSTYPQLRCSA